MSITESIPKKENDADNIEKQLDESIKRKQKILAQIPSIRNKIDRRKELNAKIELEKQKIAEEQKRKIESWVAAYNKQYDFIIPKSNADINGWIRKLKHFLNPTKALLVNMELTNGDHTTFVAYPQKESFVWEKKTYVIVNEYKYYNHATRMYCLDYHENFSLPVQRKIPLDQMRKAMAGSGITDIENATNPSTLRRFIESEIIEKIMKGQAFEDALTMLKFIAIATVIGVYLTLIVFVIKSGMLKSLPGF